jgi:DNA-binding response OmpR family regulator
LHILIIEDEAMIALAIEDALRTCGCDTFDFATSEEGAVAAARAHRPDVITADVRLAPGCGIRAVEAICAVSPIPVVFVTATAAEVHKRFPDHAVVHKPFDIRQVVNAVQIAMGQIRPSAG